MSTGSGAALGIAPKPAAPAAGEVVFAFSYLSWGAAARRGWFGSEDRLARSLVQSEVGRVLVCDRSRSLPLKLLRDRFDHAPAPFPSGADRRLLSPVRLRRSDPTTLRTVARSFAAYGRAMQRGAQQMGLERPALITTHPLVAGFAEVSWAGPVTYYALDDWTEHPGYRRWWAAYRESYRRIRERGHRVAAVSQALLDRMAPRGEGLVVPNGLEPEEWSLAASRPSELADVTGPLLVYVGTLDARLDTEWLRQTARALPDATLALVGPMVAEERLAPLRALENVRFVAPLDREALAGLIMSADVGLVPHRRSPLTEAMSPLKLYEYLAAGLPVVASDLAPMRGIDEQVQLVPDGGDFAGAVRVALAKGRAAEEERKRFVAANSWQRRHEALLDLALGRPVAR